MDDTGTLAAMQVLALRAGMQIMSAHAWAHPDQRQRDGATMQAACLAAETTARAGLLPMERLGMLPQGDFFELAILWETPGATGSVPDCCVSIARVRNGRPVIGVIHALGSGTLLTGWSGGAFRQRFDDKMRKRDATPVPVEAKQVSVRGAAAPVEWRLVARDQDGEGGRTGEVFAWRHNAAGHAILVAAAGGALNDENFDRTFQRDHRENRF